MDGALRAGSETCRLQSRLTITLHGSRPVDASTTARSASEKGIHVTGVLELHGKRYFRTWTRLAAPVVPGQTVIWLQHVVNWEPGQVHTYNKTDCVWCGLWCHLWCGLGRE